MFTSIINLIAWLKGIPSRIKGFYTDYKTKTGLITLIDGFGALSAGDVKKAKKLNRTLISNSSNSQLKVIQPITTLFQAQLAVVV